MFDNIDQLVLRLFVAVISLSFHECAHAWMAWRLGDSTAADQGRLTLNPLVHLDPFGLLMMAFGPMGWAKPVPVFAGNLRNPDRDMMLVSAAGPASNIALALLFAGAWHGLMLLDPMHFHTNVAVKSVHDMVLTFVLVNVGLAVFNMIPIGPLDGAKVLSYFLPWRQREAFESLNQYGMFILLAIIMIDPLKDLVLAPIYWLLNFLL